MTKRAKNQNIGNFIRSKRLTSGLTQEDLARLCGISRTQLSRIERNSDFPHFKTLVKIGSALKIERRELIIRVIYYVLNNPDNVPDNILKEILVEAKKLKMENGFSNSKIKLKQGGNNEKR